MKNSAIETRLKSLKDATRKLRSASEKQKNLVLLGAAEALILRSSEILKANARDMKKLKGPKFTDAFKDRLLLDQKRIEHMAQSLKAVASFPDPVGEIVEKKVLENGLRVSRIRSPLGLIMMIFESRPNVSTEAFSLAFKAGNAVILRGGSESMQTTGVLYEILYQQLEKAGLSRECLWGITDPDRAITGFLLKQKKWIDVVVPRGGDQLIEFVTKNSQIPVIKNDRGLCHAYVHDDADLQMAVDIVKNAKTQRPGVCNAIETLLVHEKVAASFLPKLHSELESFGLKWFVDRPTVKILAGKQNVKPAKPINWDTEYLDLIMNCKIVKSLDEAISHIEIHGSKHSESIVTRSESAARRFQSEIDAAALYWNASTRFTDGFALGLGGELGISTQKLHVRGPVGLKELTSVRWVMDGEGQIRK